MWTALCGDWRRLLMVILWISDRISKTNIRYKWMWYNFKQFYCNRILNMLWIKMLLLNMFWNLKSKKYIYFFYVFTCISWNKKKPYFSGNKHIILEIIANGKVLFWKKKKSCIFQTICCHIIINVVDRFLIHTCLILTKLKNISFFVNNFNIIIRQ